MKASGDKHWRNDLKARAERLSLVIDLTHRTATVYQQRPDGRLVVFCGVLSRAGDWMAGAEWAAKFLPTTPHSGPGLAPESAGKEAT